MVSLSFVFSLHDDRLDSEIRQKHDSIERKQKDLDRLNRKMEDIIRLRGSVEEAVCCSIIFFSFCSTPCCQRIRAPVILSGNEV